MTIIYNVRKNKIKACPFINLVFLVLHNVLPLANLMVLHGENLMVLPEKNWEKVCGVRKTAFSFSEEAGPETQEEVEKS